MGADAMNYIVDDAVVAVDCGQLSTHVVPLGVSEPGHVHLVVMEECDDDAVAGKDEVRNDVVDHERRQTERTVELIQQVWHDRQGRKWAQATNHVSDEHRVPRVEVVDRSRVVAKQQITEPAKTKAEPGQGFTLGARFGLLDRVEDLILVEVTAVLVVATVSQFPHVVRTPEKAVHDGSDDVVEQRELREGPVSAVVADDEQRREERALNGPVQKDQPSTKQYWRRETDKVIEHGKRDSDLN